MSPEQLKNRRQPCYWCMEKGKTVANIKCVVCSGRGYFEIADDGGYKEVDLNEEVDENMESDYKDYQAMQYGTPHKCNIG